MLTFSAILLYAWSILSLLAIKISNFNVREDRIAAGSLLFIGTLSLIAASGLVARIMS